jgi:hypothetical protein
LKSPNQKINAICLTGIIPVVLALLLSLLLPSCGRHSRPAGAHHHATIDYSRLFGHLQGTWMSYEYMLHLHKTQSPSASAAYMESIFSFTIDSARLHDDTLHCLSWVNGHEERDFWIAFDAPDSSGLYTIGISRSNKYDNDQQNADNLTKIKIDSPYITIYTSTYDSVRYIYYADLPRHTAADYPVKHYTTAALFRGEYFTADSFKIFGAGYIYFDPARVGHIDGSPAYDSFDINVNVLTQRDSIDYMELFDTRKQNESRSFIYKLKKNILQIFTNIDSPPCILRKTDPLDTLSHF